MALAGREQCPRCASRDTKFCYYNNYNTAQPRHFCRACRRYWTLGGSLRNIPVGGSSRKHARPARGPTRRAVATASSSVATTTNTAAGSSCCCGPFASSSPMTTVPAPAQSGGLLSSLLLGSVPLLQGRLEQPAGDLLAQLGFGAGPLPSVLESDRAAETTTSKPFPPAAALWQELAAAMPAGGAGLH